MSLLMILLIFTFLFVEVVHDETCGAVEDDLTGKQRKRQIPIY